MAPFWYELAFNTSLELIIIYFFPLIELLRLSAVQTLNSRLLSFFLFYSRTNSSFFMAVMYTVTVTSP